MQIQVYHLLERTKMAGPGQRFCIWVQGCNRHCTGCMAEETWSHDGGNAMSTDVLWEKIINTCDIEGITFLGGEPLEQPEAVAALAEQAQATGLSVVIFTGFTYKELLADVDPNIHRLLSSADLLIDGPFMQEQFDLSRPWVGSLNQQFNFLTDRYNYDDLSGIQNQIEIRIDKNGKTLINGMGDFSKIRKLL